MEGLKWLFSSSVTTDSLKIVLTHFRSKAPCKLFFSTKNFVPKYYVLYFAIPSTPTLEQRTLSGLFLSLTSYLRVCAMIVYWFTHHHLPLGSTCTFQMLLHRHVYQLTDLTVHFLFTRSLIPFYMSTFFIVLPNIDLYKEKK